ncbi:MAG: hemin uptake protein HemP [Alphaproteobacteria bacterium]|nr:hemin uptake protein HemP [Alphaproteobacteria bacterium]
MTDRVQHPSPAASATPRVESQDLLRDGRRVIIVHRGEEYVLQVTRAGRLILTK